MSLLNIPEELKAYPNWVGWKWEQKKNSRGVENWTKPPYDLKSNGTLRHAETDTPTTWATFEVAEAECSGFEPRFDGAGFVLPTGLGGVDFDGVIVDEKPEPFVLEILKQLGNPYTEITPSDNGLRAFFNASILPVEKGRKFHGKKEGIDKYGAEIYFGAEPGRYLTVTGKKFSGIGIPTPSDIDLVHALMSQIGNEKFKKLWMGDISDYGDDQSVADLALVSMLARLLHNDVPRIEKYFSASILGQRDKWTQRADYRERTIAKALSGKEPNISPTTLRSNCELEFHLPAVTTNNTHREYVISPALGQKDGWFPLGAVSLVGGPSGGSKTTWMLQLLLAQALRIPFFDHDTYGRPYLMLGADRGEDAHKRTMDRMNLSLASIPFKPLPLAWDLGAAQAIVDQIEATDPLPEIVFIEGCDMLVTEVNNIKAVAYFVHALQKIAQHYRVAIIGSLGSPKVKEGHGYTATRDNLLGSGGWGRTVETVALLQFPKNDDTSGRRLLTVVLRNAPAEKFPLKFVDGLLEIDPDNHEEDDGAGQASKDVEWYQEQARLAKKDPAKKWWTILDMERALKMSHATVDRHVKHNHAKGHLVQKTRAKSQGRGGQAVEYRWNESKTNPLWLAQQAQEAAEQDEAL